MYVRLHDAECACGPPPPHPQQSLSLHRVNEVVEDDGNDEVEHDQAAHAHIRGEENAGNDLRGGGGGTVYAIQVCQI